MMRNPERDIGRDQRQRDLDLRIAGEMALPQREPADRDAEQQFAGDDEAKVPAACGSENSPVDDRRHREAVEDQRGGVVGEPFALEHDEDSPRQAELARDRQRRHHVGRRDDGPEQEADAPWQPDQVMRRGRDHEGGEDHAADRQQGDDAQIEVEFAPAHRDAGRIDQRRQHQQQHQFGRQFQRGHARHEGERGAGEQQQDRGRGVDPFGQQRRARQHGEQDQEDQKFGFHGFPKSQGNLG